MGVAYLARYREPDPPRLEAATPAEKALLDVLVECTRLRERVSLLQRQLDERDTYTERLEQKLARQRRALDKASGRIDELRQRLDQ